MEERMRSETIAVHGVSLEKDKTSSSGSALSTVERLERQMALLEGGCGSSVVYSGQAALHQVVLTLARTGDEIVASGNVRPETNNLFNVLLRDCGITVNFVYTDKPSAFDGAVSPRTRFIFLEVEGSIVPEVYDIASIADIAHKNKIPFVVACGSISPVVFKPIEAGADIVIRDLSVTFGLHSPLNAGFVTDSGKFDWRVGNVPLMKAGDPIFGNIRWAFDLPKDFADSAFLLRFSLVIRRTLGSGISEESARAKIEALQSYPIRFEKQCENAMAVAKLLVKNSKVAWVRYPGLDYDAAHKNAAKQFGKMYGTLLAFGFSGKTEDSAVVADRFLNALHLIKRGADPNGAQSTARAFAKTTMPSPLPVRPAMPALLEQYPGLIRFTAGIENSKDILDDITQALKTV